MTAITFTQLRKKLGEIIERVHDNEEPITVTRADSKNVVIVPEAEWESRNDTAYLLSSPENAKRLLRAKNRLMPKLSAEKNKRLDLFTADQANEDIAWWSANDQKVLQRINKPHE